MVRATAVTAEIVRAAADGDREAFESLVRGHIDAVYAHAYRFFGDRTTAEDATQEVWIKVFRSLAEFDGRSAFSTWLFRVTRNVCLDMVRRGRRIAPPIDPIDLKGTSLDDTAGEASSAVDLERAMRSLAPEDRDAFGAVALFGLTYIEAGEVLGVPSGTVKSRVFRARRSLITSMGLESKGGA
ncbi:MAG: RNA polymerase sigma factor [Coriobacteriia bacterium]|nr:RNA polymerase sigma factor [Coriobacteriia bacterium]